MTAGYDYAMKHGGRIAEFASNANRPTDGLMTSPKQNGTELFDLQKSSTDAASVGSVALPEVAGTPLTLQMDQPIAGSNDFLQRLCALEESRAADDSRLRDENEQLRLRERDAREELLVLRTKEAFQAEFKAMVAEKDRCLAALREEHSRELGAAQASHRQELAQLRAELRNEREVRYHLASQERKATAEGVTELKRALDKERDAGAETTRALQAEIAQLRQAMSSAQQDAAHKGTTTPTLPDVTPASSVVWAVLRQALEVGADSHPCGAAAHHSAEARREAARKLVQNHERVLADVCNASETHHIDGVERLTQQHLHRVPPEHHQHVEGFLIEVARRLLGAGSQLEPRLSTTAPEVPLRVWVQAADFLDGRLQRTADQMPGRAPDLSEAAAAAMVDIMAEVAERAGAWLALNKLLQGGAAGEAEGVMAAHPRAAREEAARKLIQNHVAVRMDITNPATLAISGGKLTQARSLIRLPPEDANFVDEFLREVARRLLARRDGKRFEIHLNTSTLAQARAWQSAARYLDQRIQSSPQQSPGRKPDMSPEGAAAMKAAIKQLYETSSKLLDDQAARGLTPPPRTSLRRPSSEAATERAPTASAPEQPLRGTNAQECAAAVRQLTRAEDAAFTKWVGSKSSSALLDAWNTMLLDSLDSPQ